MHGVSDGHGNSDGANRCSNDAFDRRAAGCSAASPGGRRVRKRQRSNQSRRISGGQRVRRSVLGTAEKTSLLRISAGVSRLSRPRSGFLRRCRAQIRSSRVDDRLQKDNIHWRLGNLQSGIVRDESLSQSWVWFGTRGDCYGKNLGAGGILNMKDRKQLLVFMPQQFIVRIRMPGYMR